MKDEMLGIYCVPHKKFYYLETGNLYVHNPVPRLRNTLQQRGLIDFNQTTYMNTNDYRIVTVKQAKLEGWEMEPIYISKHVKSMVLGKEIESESEDSTPKRSWGKKTAKPEAKKKRTPRKKAAVKESKAQEQQEIE
tara:strand:- start:6569 stop:6976 length:408 start_codon:yes stop_codon:yes gene_type:complete